MAGKEFRTYNQQLKVLRSRGLIVPTNGTPKRILEKENYYNVINGYKELFIAVPKTATTEEQYKTGASFSEIYALYKFDSELRMIFLKRILRVENNIKSAIAYEFSKKYGYDNYLKMANFNLLPGNHEQLKRIIELIKNLQGDIAKQVVKHNSIRHYMSEYGYVPLWVLMNILTLGTVSTFYDLMKQTDRQSVSKRYNISDDALKKMLSVLTLCRNKCAHDERLYDFKSPKISIIDNRIHTGLGIQSGRNGAVCGKNDLLANVIILKILLNKGDFIKMATEIKKAIDTLTRELNVITIDEILNKMGFTGNWYDITGL